VTEEPQAGNAVAGVLIAYPERPGLTIGELHFRLDSLASLFTVLEDPQPTDQALLFYFRSRRIKPFLGLGLDCFPLFLVWAGL
jgi:hypothetical protein